MGSLKHQFTAHFNVLAPRYDRLFRRPASDLIRGLVDPRAGDRILDAGGGTGRTALALKGHGVWIVVCDASMGMVRRALERDLPAVLADVARLPFASGVFDKTLVVDAFHHFVGPDTPAAQSIAAGELLRTLRMSGRLVLEEPDTTRWQAKLIAAAERALLMRSRFLSPVLLEEFFTGHGFKKVLRTGQGFSVDIVFEKATCSPLKGVNQAEPASGCGLSVHFRLQDFDNGEEGLCEEAYEADPEAPSQR